MFCNNCGNTLSDNEKFCSNCGQETDLTEGIKNSFDALAENNSIKNNKILYFIVFGMFVLCGILLSRPIYNIKGWFGMSQGVGIFELADSKLFMISSILLYIISAIVALLPILLYRRVDCTYLLPMRIIAILTFVSMLIVLFIGKDKSGSYDIGFSFTFAGVLLMLLLIAVACLPFVIKKYNKLNYNRISDRME